MKLGLATRTNNDADRRTFMVALTARAARIYDRMAADALALESRMVAGLRRNDVRILLMMLDSIETSLRRPADKRRLWLMQGARMASGDGAPRSRRR
jgi:DNA-binding MarR family transcriptional regulator